MAVAGLNRSAGHALELRSPCNAMMGKQRQGGYRVGELSVTHGSIDDGVASIRKGEESDMFLSWNLSRRPRAEGTLEMEVPR